MDLGVFIDQRLSCTVTKKKKKCEDAIMNIHEYR